MDYGGSDNDSDNLGDNPKDPNIVLVDEHSSYSSTKKSVIPKSRPKPLNKRSMEEIRHQKTSSLEVYSSYLPR